MSTETQTQFQERAGGASQNAIILEELMDRSGEWCSALALENASGSRRMNSRAADLRRLGKKLGFTIENKTERVDGVVHSYYRLVPAEP